MKQQKNIPALLELFNRKKSYDIHLQKLQRIRDTRRSSLTKKATLDKTITIQHIRDQKQTNFLTKLSKEDKRIEFENLRFGIKLHRTTTLINNRDDNLSKSSLSMSVRRQRDRDIQRENQRMFRKLNSSQSYVNSKKIARQYENARKIKDRLRKYDDDCSLKSEKIIKTCLSLNNSKKPLPSFDQSQPKKTPFQYRFKSKIASHYNREDIVKNKIQFRTIQNTKNIKPTKTYQQKPQRKDQFFSFFNTQFDNPEFKSKKP